MAEQHGFVGQDHDQRFKVLIREFFADFMRLFFATWASRFDFTEIDWLDQELLPAPPDGVRLVADLVARLRVLEPVAMPDGKQAESWLAIIHIEIEAPDRTTRLEPRLPGYYVHLRERHQLPVLPIVIYLKVGLDGVGTQVVTERFWETDILTLKYLYVGLPGLNAQDYVHGKNWLGVALSALMRMPANRAAELGAEALQRLTEAPLTINQRLLLGDCVQAYLPLDEAQSVEFERILLRPEYEGARAMNKTSFELGHETGMERGIERGMERGMARGMERGMEQGMERGRNQGHRELVIAVLEGRFGPLSGEALSKIEQLSDLRILQLARDIGKAQSLAELGLV